MPQTAEKTLAAVPSTLALAKAHQEGQQSRPPRIAPVRSFPPPEKR